MKQHISLLLLVVTLSTVVEAQSWWQAIRDRMCQNVAPSEPRNVLAIPGDSRVDLGWLRPANTPCDVVYQITELTTSSSYTRSVNITDSMRATFEGLTNGVTHKFIIRAVTPLGVSKSVEVVTTPAPRSASLPIVGYIQPIPRPNGIDAYQGWKCVAKTEPPSCQAAANGMCGPRSCDSHATAGRCDDLLLKHTDWTSLTVTQYCSNECGCEARPSLRTSMDDPAVDACCALSTGQYWSAPDGRVVSDV